MTRPVIQLHTIEQWSQLDPSIQNVILQNIKLADRLKTWLLARQQQTNDFKEPKWVPCKDCDAVNRGWVLKEPRYPGIHPSQLPHPCMLKVWNEMKGLAGREKHEPKTLLIFDLGHAVHRMMQNYGKHGAWGPIYTAESKINASRQPLAEELFIEGSADGENILVIDDIPNAPIYELGIVHEYKTSNSRNFDKLTRPKSDHQKQANIYAKVLNRPVVVYLYMNKDTSNLADFPVPFDAGAWKVLEDKARLLVQYYDADQPPPAETGYHCEQCPYAFTCGPYAESRNRRRVAQGGR